MLIPDVNVLVNAFRGDAKDHLQAHQWLTETVQGPDRLGIYSPILTGMVRITTNRKAWGKPSELSEVLDFVDVLLSQAVILETGPNYWSTFQDLARRTNARGNLLTDLSYAAVAIVHRAVFVTFDRDFERFPGLDCVVLT